MTVTPMPFPIGLSDRFFESWGFITQGLREGMSVSAIRRVLAPYGKSYRWTDMLRDARTYKAELDRWGKLGKALERDPVPEHMHTVSAAPMDTPYKYRVDARLWDKRVRGFRDAGTYISSEEPLTPDQILSEAEQTFLESPPTEDVYESRIAEAWVSRR